MKKLIVIAMLATAGYAIAACPIGTVYGCVQMPNGKMACGCR
jgi:hypothetical protein